MVGNSDFYLKGVAGNITPTSDGSLATARFARMNDLVVSQYGPRYYEAASRGNMFCLALNANTTTTTAAGNITGAAAAASTNFAVWNPVNSGKELVLIKLWVGIVSGTPVGGPMFHNYFNASAVSINSTLTNGTLTNAYIQTGGGQGGVAKGLAVAAGSNLTGGGALTSFRQSSIFFSAAAFASASGSYGMEEFAGDIIIPPGMGYVPCYQGAGTTLLSYFSLVWLEVPI